MRADLAQRARLRRELTLLTPICLCALLIAGVSFWVQAQPVKVTPEQIRSLGIETAPLKARQAGQIRGLSAQVVIPNQQLHVVSAPLAGLVERVLVATQQPVKKGQVLARLQSPDLADLQHTYLQAATQAKLARSNLDRDEKLFADGIISESRLLAARSHFEEVSADLAERTQALRLSGMTSAAVARLSAGEGVGTAVDLASPIDGVVLEQLAVTGQRVEAASPVFRVAQLRPLWLEIQVPVGAIPSIAEGAQVAVAAQDAEARVISISRNVGAGQTAMVRAEVERGASHLRPGQFVEAALTTRSSDGRWLVPNAALARVGGNTVVFVRGDGEFRAQPVTLASEGASESLVAGELTGDEQIAVKGVASLKAALLGIGAE